MIAWILARPWSIAIAALTLLLSIQTARLKFEQSDHQSDNAKFAIERANLIQKSLETETRYRAEETRRVNDQAQIAQDAQTQLDAAQTAAAGSADVARKLREQIARVIANDRKPSGNPATAVAGQTADTAPGVPAELFGRIDSATDAIAQFADRSHIAGQACEMSYASLLP